MDTLSVKDLYKFEDGADYYLGEYKFNFLFDENMAEPQLHSEEVLCDGTYYFLNELFGKAVLNLLAILADKEITQVTMGKFIINQTILEFGDERIPADRPWCNCLFSVDLEYKA